MASLHPIAVFYDLEGLSFTLRHSEWSICNQKTNDPSHSPAHQVQLAFMPISIEADEDPLRESLESRIHG